MPGINLPLPEALGRLGDKGARRLAGEIWQLVCDGLDEALYGAPGRVEVLDTLKDGGKAARAARGLALYLLAEVAWAAARDHAARDEQDAGDPMGALDRSARTREARVWAEKLRGLGVAVGALDSRWQPTRQIVVARPPVELVPESTGTIQEDGGSGSARCPKKHAPSATDSLEGWEAEP